MGRQRWAVLGAVLVVIGAWIGGKHHRAGFLIALLPVGVGAAASLAAWSAGRRLAARRRRAIEAQLAALRAGGFSPQLVLEGDLRRGEAWAAFDFGAAQARVVTDEASRAFPLAQLAGFDVREWTSLGSALPEHYSLRLAFEGNPEVDIMASSRPQAAAWAQALRARMGSR